ncbi:MAG: helix-turn-helix domain-containing protein [Planctomycetes bacterium]|nr:helix-turn-helix domain-containing protein [Planctomycetota bacterium]MBI3844757.1 helix-turn-helix domain-containing protein [Planctomycetota bacterium]
MTGLEKHAPGDLQREVRYLQTRRLAAAERLLRTTDRDVTTNCLEVGFESLGSFSTLFVVDSARPRASSDCENSSAFAARCAGARPLREGCTRSVR